MILQIIFIFLFVVITQSVIYVIKKNRDEVFWKLNEFKNFGYKVHGAIVWRSRSVAVTAFLFYINDIGEVFVLANKRGNGTPDYQGYWNVPCGYLDFNESGEEAAAREVFEETGVKIKPECLKLVSTNTKPTQNKQNVSFRYCAFVNDRFVKDNPLTTKHCEEDEVDDVQWVNLFDIKNKEWAFNHDKLIPEIHEEYTLMRNMGRC